MVEQKLMIPDGDSRKVNPIIPPLATRSRAIQPIQAPCASTAKEGRMAGSIRGVRFSRMAPSSDGNGPSRDSCPVPRYLAGIGYFAALVLAWAFSFFATNGHSMRASGSLKPSPASTSRRFGPFRSTMWAMYFV